MSMERSKERREAWEAANRENILAYHSEYNHRYYQAHREQLLAKHSEWQRTHRRFTKEQREKQRVRNKEYYQAHKEELLYKQKCRACGIQPTIEPIAIPHPQTHIHHPASANRPATDPRYTCDRTLGSRRAATPHGHHEQGGRVRETIRELGVTYKTKKKKKNDTKMHFFCTKNLHISKKIVVPLHR